MSTLKTPIKSYLSTSLWCSSRIRSRTSSFRLITNPLSTVISNSSANHHLYVDDTQLFLSFSAADFACNISHLEHTISNVYNWVSCHLTFFLSIPLRLSFFLLVFLYNSQNSVILSFIDPPNNVTLSPDHSAPNLGVIFDSNLTFLNTFPLFLNHTFIIFVTSDAFEIPLIILQPALLLFL